MNASGHEPAPAPQPRPPQVVTAPPGDGEASKPGVPAAALDRPHEDHADEPGYGHGV
jgi:hypothetical protein